MERQYKRWVPNVGDKLTGNILYFTTLEKSLIALLRNEDSYYLLPGEALESFAGRTPPDGDLVEIEFTPAGFRIRSC